MAIMLHYWVLTSFSWMAVQGLNLYISIVKVIVGCGSGFLWKASIFAFGKCIFVFRELNKTHIVKNHKFII